MLEAHDVGAVNPGEPQPTGSAPNLTGDPKLFTGEATGIVAMVATKRWADGGPDDTRRWIFPDIPVPSLFEDWAAGRDPALEAALSAKPAGPDDFKARARYFERPGQETPWRPFWLTG